MQPGGWPGRGPLPDPPQPVQEGLDEALAPFGSRPARHLSLPLLEAAQRRVDWLSPEIIAYISRRTGLPVAELSAVAAFYDLLAAEPRGRRHLRVCDDIACRTGGYTAAALDFLADRLQLHPGEQTADGAYSLETCSCLGTCDQPPAMRSDAGIRAISGATAQGWLPGYEPVLLSRCGKIDPTSLDDYRRHGGMIGLERALALGPEGVIEAVKDSGLVGRGGAAFPTGRKWEAAAREANPEKYVILNADESEPGTFTNRKLLEEDPFLVLEGLLIAAYAVGARRGYAYIRGEYDLAIQRFERVLEAARQAGYLGSDILGRGFAFDVEIRRGAGAYVCGEETALFESIEGRRGEPRNKPPYPTQAGLFGRPTVVNNTETLACVPAILTEGAHAFQAKNPKLFSVSGRVRRPGVYEVPLGTSLRRVLEELAGGWEGELQAVLVGGAAGGFLRPEELDVPLHFEELRQIGSALGSGAVVVFNTEDDLWEVARRIGRFFAEESCGQCTPCREGTLRQNRLLGSWVSRGVGSGEAEDYADLVATMEDASICGLGQTAGSAVQSLLAKFGPPGGGAGTPRGGAGGPRGGVSHV